jgi:chloramphenicol 3-O-phosphotransferase
MSVLILTAPSAAGKNAVASAVASLCHRLAVIDVDVVRYMVVQPHKIPGAVTAELGYADELDWRVGVNSACRLAISFAESSFEVMVLDVLTHESMVQYRSGLRAFDPKVVLLLPSLDEVMKRHRERGPEPEGSFMRGQGLAAGGWRLSAEDVVRLYRQQESLTGYDIRMDSSSLSPEEVAKQLVAYL